ncbi:HTH_Tnp_Tc3_2 domain-containing protein [Trichonephila clavipes]|nr:HTH_Tnp_Tc3_2 domain-containing protein [Trichonephila clavipes]
MQGARASFKHGRPARARSQKHLTSFERQVLKGLFHSSQNDGNDSSFITGHPRGITPNENRYLEVTDKKNRRSTASDLSRQLSSATGTTVSRQTMYRCLGHIGLYARRPVRCVPLTATHCRLRLTWSRDLALWTPQQWSCVMFSDQSRFSLSSDFSPDINVESARYPLPTREHHKTTPLRCCRMFRLGRNYSWFQK